MVDCCDAAGGGMDNLAADGAVALAVLACGDCSCFSGRAGMTSARRCQPRHKKLAVNRKLQKVLLFNW